MLTVTDFGPFTDGVVDAANPSLNMTGSARYIRNAILSGKGRLMTARGSAVAITLMDDAGTPAPCTSVQLIEAFGDGALAVGHSTATQKTYLYRLDANLTGWYNFAGTFHASSTATPLATALWTGQATPVPVTMAEILGVAYIATTEAANATAFVYATRKFTGAAITNMTANLGTGGTNPVYFLGVFAFHGHLFGWGFDKGVVPADAFRPELLRHGGPDGGDLDAAGAGSFTVGHRIRSARESVVAVCVAGDVAYVGTTYSLWPIVGYGRDTWDKSHPLDDSYGFIGLHGQIAANNGWCCYWSPRGPARVQGLNAPESLWDRLASVIPTIVDPHRIIAAFDADADQVSWYYRGGTETGNRLICSYDVRRNLMLGPDADAGINVGAAGLVAPIASAGAAPGTTAPGPSAPPAGLTTSYVGVNSAVVGWTMGDTSSGVSTRIEYRVQGTTAWTLGTEIGGGAEGCFLVALTANTAYEWRAAHVKNAQLSAYTGPVAGSRFVTGADATGGGGGGGGGTGTVGVLQPPTNVVASNRGPGHWPELLVTWTNSADAGVSTAISVSGNLTPGFPGVFTYAPGVASALIAVDQTDDYTIILHHYKAGFDPSADTTPVVKTIIDNPTQ